MLDRILKKQISIRRILKKHISTVFLTFILQHRFGTKIILCIADSKLANSSPVRWKTDLARIDEKKGRG